MIFSKKYSIMIGISLVWTLAVGCGSGVDDTKKVEGALVADDKNETPNSENNGTLAITYEQGSGVLLEKLDGQDHLVWVNTSDDGICKISRSASRTSTAYADAQEHCQNLIHAGFTNWRVPTVTEAESLMQLENKSILIYPTSNPNCAIMITDRENTFVYTTSDWNTQEIVGTKFVDSQRNAQTAGIRCVANSQ